MYDVVCVLDAKAAVGECPVWCGLTQSLYWVDIPNGKLNCFSPMSGINRMWTFAEPIGSFGLRAQGGAILALKSGFHLFDFVTGDLEKLVNPEPDKTENRLNDGRCDRAGRFWAGSMRDPPDPMQKTGALYRLGADYRCSQMIKDLFVSNGLAFSPDDRILYHSDSHVSVRIVWAWDFDLVDGAISNRRVFVETAGMPGRPDGAAVDADGCYWMAAVDGWEVVRFTPAGKIDRRIALPVSQPSMIAFGGRDLDTMYITSIRPPDTDLSKQPQAGGLFAVNAGVKGLPEPRYVG
jgi:L-arabinonolactonase